VEKPESNSSASEAEDHAAEANRLLRWAAYIAVAVGAVAVVAIGFFIYGFKSASLSADVAHWGQTGDYFGGIINPAVGLATVLLIFIGIHIQRTELRATEKQLKETASATRVQNFENALFSWLDRYQRLIESIEDSVAKKHGRDALRAWYLDTFASTQGFFERSVRHGSVDAISHDIYLNKLKDLPPDEAPEREDVSFLEQSLEDSLVKYENLYAQEVSSLDAPWRTLYRILRWIDKSEFTREQKWHYVAVIRAQLSWIEMVYLLFNGLTEVGEAFNKYADRYAIFDNLAPVGDLNVWFSKWNHMTHEHTGVRCYYSASAFSSMIAKKNLGIRSDA